MARENSLDTVDQDILRILSLYESLDAVELWYEIGEDDTTAESFTKEEIVSRLESLSREGFVKCIEEPRGRVKWAVNRRE